MNEVCPNCGAWTYQLDDLTGWCGPCAGHKTCTRCTIAKPLTDYRPHGNAVDGHRGTCRACENLQSSARRSANLDHERWRDRQKKQRHTARLKAL